MTNTSERQSLTHSDIHGKNVALKFAFEKKIEKKNRNKIKCVE